MLRCTRTVWPHPSLRRSARRAPRSSTTEQLEDPDRRGRVEVACGLVAQHEARLTHQGACDRNSLSLAPGQPSRQELGAIAHPHLLEHGIGSVSPTPPIAMAVDLRDHDVVEHAAMGEQMERLKDEADATRPKAGSLPIT